jgi:hypothetical protein
MQDLPLQAACSENCHAQQELTLAQNYHCFSLHFVLSVVPFFLLDESRTSHNFHYYHGCAAGHMQLQGILLQAQQDAACECLASLASQK